jgi:hypothetical protein
MGGSDSAGETGFKAGKCVWFLVLHDILGSTQGNVELSGILRLPA